MRSKTLSLSLLFVACLSLSLTVLGQQNQILVLTTFDYPGAGNSTTPLDINDRGEIVGYYQNGNVRRGFRRRSGGTISSIVEPNDTGNYTIAYGINNNQTIVGDYFHTADFNNGIGAFHGFLLRNGVYTQYDGGTPSNGTGVLGINDRENFVGGITDPVLPQIAFINIGGTQSIINIPGAIDAAALGINNGNRTVGRYSDTTSPDHGFIRAPNGTVTKSVDYPGSRSTRLRKINNSGLIVGLYTDVQGREHGLVRKPNNTYVSFDYPGAAGTELTAINNFGFLTGRFTDTAGIRHGFIAWFRGNGGGGRDNDNDNDEDDDH